MDLDYFMDLAAISDRPDLAEELQSLQFSLTSLAEEKKLSTLYSSPMTACWYNAKESNADFVVWVEFKRNGQVFIRTYAEDAQKCSTLLGVPCTDKALPSLTISVNEGEKEKTLTFLADKGVNAIAVPYQLSEISDIFWPKD